MSSISEVDKLISHIDELSREIIDKFNKDELDNIDVLLDKRFSIFQSLFTQIKWNKELQSKIQKLLEQDKVIIDEIIVKQNKINDVLVNINNLSKYNYLGGGTNT